MMMFCLLVVMWLEGKPSHYLDFLASWSTSGRSSSLSSCSLLSFLAFAFSCSVFLVFTAEEEPDDVVFLVSRILLNWNTMKFHIRKAWRKQTAMRELSLMSPVLKLPLEMSRDCCSAGSLARPNQNVRTDKMTEERRAKTKRRSPSLNSLLEMLVFSE